MSRIFEVLKNIFKIGDLRKRILITLLLLLVFRLGSFIPLPGVNAEGVKQLMDQAMRTYGRFMGLLGIFSGGAFARISLFSLGIMPYITSNIIFSMLVKVVPSLERLSKEGPSGYRKIREYERYATIPICLVQSIFVIGALERQNVLGGIQLFNRTGFWSFELPAVFGILAGAFFVMWLGELISEFGIGNGASLIITVGIIARMPSAFSQMWDHREQYGTINILILTALYVLIVVAVVYMTQAQRRIPIQYGKYIRGQRMYTGGARQYLPLSINQANVMPVIFASSVMALPLAFGHLVHSTRIIDLFGRTGFFYTVLYIAMVFFFTYFWTALMFQPREMADNLKEHGSFVPGIRPGEKTAEYLEYIMNRVTLVGAAFLAMIAIFPDVVAQMLHLDLVITSFLGGTGILIVVGVCLDTARRIESHLLMHQYEGIVKNTRIRTRR